MPDGPAPATFANDDAWLRCQSALRDFEAAWRDGGRPRIEDFLPTEPALRASVLPEFVHVELGYRHKAGEPVSLADYAERFPGLTAERTFMSGLASAAARLQSRDTGEETCVDHRGAMPSSTLSHPARLPQVPGYVLQGEVGRGGMGVVYRAFQTTLSRVVALKMLRPAADPSPADLARLRTEAAVIGRLQHANIVQIYDVGEADGLPFLAMEFVNGASLASRIKQRPLPWPEAARLAETLARALHYAHTRGIVHRDMSPGNVLLQSGDGQTAIPKITDFGLAKILIGDDADKTQTGAILGTPSYMAPEQAEGNVRLVGPRTDVYGLGAVLYAALSGKPPFRGETPWQTTRLVIEQEPAPMSQAVAGVPRDLETICLKCLRKAPHNRYGSAEDVADDLRRLLNNEPIAARPVGAIERTRLWARRNPAAAITAGIATLAVLLTAGLGLWQVLVERNNLRIERDRAQVNLYRSLISDARAQMKARDTGWWNSALSSLRKAAALDVTERDPLQLRNLVLECLGTEFPCFDLQTSWKGHSAPVLATAIRGDGTLIATASADRTVKLWAVPAGDARATLSGNTEPVTGVAFQPNGSRLASCALDGTVRIWDIPVAADPPALSQSLDLKAGSVNSVAFSSDGAQIAAACEDGSVFIIAANGSAAPRLLAKEPAEATFTAFQPGKQAVAIALFSKQVRFRDVQTGRELFTHKYHSPTTSLAFSADGSRVAVADPESFGFGIAVAQPDVTPGVLGQLHTSSVRSLAWISRIRNERCDCWLSTSLDGSLRLWRGVESLKPRQIAIAQGDFGPTETSAASEDGSWITAGYVDGQVRLWRLTVPEQRRVPIGGGSPAATFVARSHRLVNPPAVHDLSPEFDVQTARQPQLEGSRIAVWGIAASPDGRWIATASHDSVVRIFDSQTLKIVHELRGHPTLVWSVAFSPDSRMLASGAGDLRLWDVATGKETHRFDVGRALVRSLAFHPHEPMLVAAIKDQTLRAWNLTTREPIGPPIDVDREIMGLAFRPDGKRLAAASDNQQVLVWEVNGLSQLPAQPAHSIAGHRAPVWAVTYSPDGRWLASGSERGVILLDGQSHDHLATLKGVEGQVRALSFSTDAEVLAGAAYTKPMTLWNIPRIRRTLAEMKLDWPD